MVDDVRLIRFCRPQYAKSVLTTDRHIWTMMLRAFSVREGERWKGACFENECRSDGENIRRQPRQGHGQAGGKRRTGDTEWDCEGLSGIFGTGKTT